MIETSWEPAMHKYGLVEALLERVEREASAHEAAAVRRIAVGIAPLAGVDRELLADAYRMCRPGTRCEDTGLLLKTDEVDWRCHACDATILAGAALVCPHRGMARGAPVGHGQRGAVENTPRCQSNLETPPAIRDRALRPSGRSVRAEQPRR
jgi:Zn finger protein HypA/HybF involved in hydrogenase expression